MRYYTAGGRRRRIEADDEMSINYGPVLSREQKIAQWRGMLDQSQDPEYRAYVERQIAALEAQE